MKNWELRFFLDNEEEKSYAWVAYNHDNRVADIHLTKDWSKLNASLTDDEIKKTAFHEITEIFLYPLRYLADSRYVLSWDTIDCAVHDIVRTLEAVIFNREGYE